MRLSEISSDIPSEVYKYGEENAPTTTFSFVSILSYTEGRIVERSFGMRRYSKKGLKITEVRRRSTGEREIYVKNLLHSMFGYVPVFEKEDRYSNGYWGYKVFDARDYDEWYVAETPCNFHCLCLNSELLSEIPKFKFCGYSSGDIIEYLTEYLKNPRIEFFGKLDIPVSHILIKQAEKDKKFRTMLAKERLNVRAYGPQATVYAYKHGMTIPEASRKLCDRRRALKKIPAMRKQKIDDIRIIEYCKTKKVDTSNYNDYLEAIIALGLDLNDTKNLYPNNFRAMHDLRIAEYEALKAKIDEKKRRALYKAFAVAGERAAAYEFSKDRYTMIAPREITDLVTEGKALEHCVGRMGYDKKMADGAVVIMFVRKTSEPKKPFVTVEYDLHEHKVRQAYGKKNTRPSDEVMVFISEWVCMMKKIMKKETKI